MKQFDHRRRRQPKAKPVVWTNRALVDLETIGEYIGRDDPRAAARWVAQLLSRADRIAPTPYMGRQVPEFGREDLREILVRNYRIVYQLHANAISVLTVFEGRRQFPAQAIAQPRKR